MPLSSRRHRQGPCLCGSSRSLAVCCLPWEEAYQRLISRLVAFANSPRIRRHEADAAAVFWNIQGAVRPGKGLGPEGGLRFLEWFVHDYRPRRAKGTLIASFADSALGVSPHEEHLLLASLFAPVRAYEVTDPPGSRFTMVTDLLTGGQYAIGPPVLPGPPIRSDLLICRLVFFGRLMRSGAGALVLPGSCREELLLYLRTAYRLARPARHVSLEDFLDGSPHLYHHFFLLRGRNLGGRGVETLRSAAFGPGRVIYKGQDLSRIRATLDRQPELEGDETGGDEARYAWVDLERAVTRASVLARSGEVELRADSQEDLAAAKGFLETCLRGLIQPVEEQAVEPAELFEDEGRRTGSGIPGASFLARVLDRWADTPHPLLDGHTPRDAMKFRAEREQVAWLLADLERDMARLRRLGRAWADVGPVREALSLPPA